MEGGKRQGGKGRKRTGPEPEEGGGEGIRAQAVRQRAKWLLHHCLSVLKRLSRMHGG